MNKDKIEAYLRTHCKGRKKTVSSSVLCKALNISDNELRKQINRMRRENVPIASSKDGYYYAETAAEVYSTIKGLEKMKKGLDAAISGLENALDSFSGGRQ